MKATVIWAGALVGLALSTTSAFAFGNGSPVFFTPYPVAPDACGPGFYAACPNGMVYGPNYYLRPPGSPYSGPAMGMPAAPAPAFQFNPYVRGPRDFFMWRENMEDQLNRSRRPALVP